MDCVPGICEAIMPCGGVYTAPKYNGTGHSTCFLSPFCLLSSSRFQFVFVLCSESRTMSFSLSDYALGLPSEDKCRYLEKLKGIMEDPYAMEMKDFSANLNDLPKITYEVITNFLIFRVNTVSQEEIRAFKSLEAFAHIASGWIREIKAKKYDNCYCVIGKVLHSQRMSEAPLKCWVIISNSGEILSSHCNCIAGLGEACTHIAAVLFAFEYAGKQQTSVTDVFAYWMGPRSKKHLYKKIAETDFARPFSHKQPPSTKKNVPIPELDEEEVKNFLTDYKDDGNISAIEIFFTPSDAKKDYILTSLYDEQFKNCSLEELQLISEGVCFTFEDDLVKQVEKDTREQSSSNKWFLLRAGRVTASNFKAVCHTKLEKPSMSLLKRLCYPHKYKQTFKAGIYGCKHEKNALRDFMTHHNISHPNAKIKKCGLFLNVRYPFFAATPDAILECDVCGNTCVEIKCPYCARDTSITELLEKKKNFSLKRNEEGVWLDRKHQYYYQVQMQMAMTKLNTCYFVVWSSQDLFFERIPFDPNFWNEKSGIATIFEKKVVLPELLGHFFTQQVVEAEPQPTPEAPHETSFHENLQLYCYCRKPHDEENMILCNNKTCKIRWFHIRCVGLEKIIKKWTCHSCRE